MEYLLAKSDRQLGICLRMLYDEGYKGLVVESVINAKNRILNSAFSIALWGEDRSRGGSNNYYGNNRGQRNSYDGYYQGSQNNRPNPPPVRRSLQNLDFESRGDAEDTLAGLRDALYRYRQVSVGDLWDLMGVTNDSTDYNYGWYNLDDAFIKGIPGGFRLILPHTVPLR